MIWLFLACSGTDTGTAPLSTDLVWTDDNTASYALDVSFDDVASARANSDIIVDWSGLTTDLAGRPVEADEMTVAAIAGLYLDQEVLTERIETNDIRDGDLLAWAETGISDGRTQLSLSDLSLFGQPFNPNDTFEENLVWLLMVGLGPEALSDNMQPAGMLLITADSDGADTVQLTSDSSTAAVTADFVTATAIAAPAGNPDLTLDWSDVTAHSRQGAPETPVYPEQIVIGHTRLSASAAQDVAQTLFDDLDQRYSLEVEGRDVSADLSLLTDDATGDPFPGFSTEGTWLVALYSSVWPGPEIVAVIDVQPES